MSTPNNVDDFMSGGSKHPLIRLENVGSTLIGDLVEARLVDERDYDTGEIKRWDDGNPRKQLVIDVRIDWAKSVDITTGKNGIREDVGSYYCRYTAFLAMQEAVKAAGCKMSEVGRLALRRTQDGQPKKAGFGAPQQFVAQVARAAAGASVDDMFAAAPAQPAAPAAPAPPPVPAMAASDLL
jgi:hypothetical protein